MLPDQTPNNRQDPAPRSGLSARPRDGRMAPKASGFDMWIFLRALRRRWLLAAVLGVLLSASVGAAVWFFLPPGKHTVSSLLYVAAVPKTILHPVDPHADFHTFKATQSALVRSHMVLNSALKSPRLTNNRILAEIEQPIEWLEKELKVTGGASPEIMQISLAGYADEIPDLTAIVSAVTDAYLKEIVHKERGRIDVRQQQLRDLAKRQKEKLDGLRKKFQGPREMAGPDAKTREMRRMQAEKEYKQASDDLATNRRDQRSLGTLLEQLKAGQGEMFAVSNAEAEAAVEKEPAVVRARTVVSEMESLLTEMVATAANPNVPAVVRVRNELKTKEKELENKRKQLRPQVMQRLKEEKKRNAGVALETLNQKLALLKSLEKLLEAACENLNAQRKGLTQDGVKLADVQAEMDEALSLINQLNKRAELLAFEFEADDRITKLQEDPVVQRPDELVRKIRFGALGAVAALGLVLLAVGFLELRTRRLTSAQEVTEQIGLHIVGSLPFCAGKKAKQATAQQQLKEAVDSARTLLLHTSQMEGIKVVQVASSVSGEGKTSLACHLALSLARAGRRTLLMDADLRKPNVHGVFGAQQGPGISEYLRGECTLDEATQETRMPGLSLIAAGHLDEKVLGAVAQNGLASMLNQVRGRYDFIIIDSSPVLPVPDALMIGQHADGVLFAVMQDVTRIHQLATAADRLSRVGARILGAVVNGSRETEHYAYGQYARYLTARAEQPG